MLDRSGHGTLQKKTEDGWRMVAGCAKHLGQMVQGLGFKVQGLGSRVQGLGFGVQSLGVARKSRHPCST